MEGEDADVDVDVDVTRARLNVEAVADDGLTAGGALPPKKLIMTDSS